VLLDPSYTKAWGRLGNAALVRDTSLGLNSWLMVISLKGLKSWAFSITAFEKGLKTLPSDDSEMTAGQKDIKVLFEAGIAKAKASKELPPGKDAPKGKESASRWRPWERAAELIRTKNIPSNSSVRLNIIYFVLSLQTNNAPRCMLCEKQP
jgi:hypothetical protein